MAEIKVLRIQYLGRTPKTVELPIPYLSKTDKTGEVICNPIGEFDPKNGQALLDLVGQEGMFKLVETVYEGEPLGASNSTSTVSSLLGVQFSLCQCGCGKSVSKEGNKFILGHSARYPKKPATPKPLDVGNEQPTPAA